MKRRRKTAKTTRIFQKSELVEIYLVGAGPGRAEFLTVQAIAVLKRASSVLYDHLISQESLSLAPKGATLLYTGKRSGTKHLEQENINKKLLAEAKRLSLQSREERKALTGKTEKKSHSLADRKVLIRLKGGDPLLFSHAEEELASLTKAGYRVEIIPGLSAYQVAAAAAQLPLTRRGLARSLSIVSGKFAPWRREAKTSKKNRSIGLSAAADEKSVSQNSAKLIRSSDTLVYFMGVKNIREIVQSSLEAGLSPNTNVLAVERVALPGQKIHCSVLKDLLAYHEKHSIRKPAILFIGKTVSPAISKPQLQTKPLDGCRVGLLGQKEEYAALAQLLHKEGAEIIELPVFQIKPIQPAKTLMQRLLQQGNFTSLLFSSARAVRFFFQALDAARLDIRALASIRDTIAIAPATMHAMREYGLQTDWLASTSRGSQEAIRACIEKNSLNNILFPRALEARPYLEEYFKQRSLHYHILPLYEKKAAFPLKFKKTLAARALTNTEKRAYEKKCLARLDKAWSKNLVSYDFRGFEERMKAIDVLLLCSGKEAEMACHLAMAYGQNWKSSLCLGESSYTQLSQKHRQMGLGRLEAKRHYMSKETSFAVFVEKLIEIRKKDTGQAI